MFLQVKNILYHAVKEMVRALKIHEGEMEDMDENWARSAFGGSITQRLFPLIYERYAH